MRNKSSVMVAELINKENTPQRGKFRNLLASNDPQLMPTNNNDDDSSKHSNASSSSGYFYDSNSSCSSPFNASSSPYSKSPWNITTSNFGHENNVLPQIGLIGSIVREEGHVYSLATSGDLLYTGSDSKNVRIWKNLKDYSGFKSSSGLVKAIVIANEKVFTGHQDGKIRVWKMSLKNPSVHKRTGSLPKFKDTLRSSINPKNYVEVRRKRSALRIKHHDAVSCMSLNEHLGILYSGSWDRTVKVWRIADSKCIESIIAHDDAVNSIAVGFDSIVFTGSADGTVRMWKRELQGKTTQHKMISVLLSQENAVTALAVNKVSGVVYCGSSDGLVNFWEREKQSSITLLHGGVLKGHKMAVLCLAAAGNLVFSGSADRNICVWRRDHGGTHTCLAVLAGHMGPVKCLAVEEDKEAEKGQRNWIVYSGSLDRSVKVWRVCENSPEFQSNAGITAASGDARMIGHSLHGSQNGETFLKST